MKSLKFLIYGEKTKLCHLRGVVQTEALSLILEYIKKTSKVYYKLCFLILLLFSPFISYSQLNCLTLFSVFKRLKPIQKVELVQNNSERQELPNPYEFVRKSIWQITVDIEGVGIARSTGFFISPNQFITNFHAVNNMTDLEKFPILLSQEDSSSILTVKHVLALSALDDLALLETDQSVDSWLNIAETSSQNDSVLFTAGYNSRDSHLGHQIKEKENGNRYYHDYYFRSVIDSDMKPGRSGSPVYNENGEVTGVVSAISMSDSSSMYAVGWERLKALLKNPPLNCRSFRCIMEEKRKFRSFAAEHPSWYVLGKILSYERAEVSYPINKNINNEGVIYPFK